MVTRVSAPVSGANGRGPYIAKGKNEVSVTGRYLHAIRHFHDKNVENIPAGPSVILGTLDLSWTRQLTKRNSLTLSIPYIEGNFIRSFRFIQPEIHSESETSGLGDIMLTWRKWIFDPDKHPDQNFRFALGLKFPTGDYKQQSVRPVNIGTPAKPNIVNLPTNADTAIQPGDGGLGVLLGLEAFHRIGSSQDVWYGELSYLANPRDHNDLNNQDFGPGPYVPTNVTSVPDYFLGRTGVAFPEPFKVKHLSFQSGLRIEGQPIRDLIGGDGGFRRPGYSLAFEPGLSHTQGDSSIYMSVPITIYRRRWLSVDEQFARRTSAVSAAFADYNFLLGYARRF